MPEESSSNQLWAMRQGSKAAQFPTEIDIEPADYAADCLSAFEAARRLVKEDRLVEILSQLVAIQSLPGQEKAIASYCAEFLHRAGLESAYQRMDSFRGNAVARLRGNGTGPDLMFCAPLDFAFGEPGDEPWLGQFPRWDFSLEAEVSEGQVIGLGAENPKAHVACVLATLEILAQLDVPWRGDLIAGLVAGGMPVTRDTSAENDAEDVGFGSGCAFMLKSGVTADYAVLAKTGSAITWEEAGLCWFRLDVFGDAFYSGTSNYTNLPNSIENASKIIIELQRLLKQYSLNFVSGTVSPEANITAVRGGRFDKGIIAPEVVQILVDMRLNPQTSTQQARRIFASMVAELRRIHPDVNVEWDMLISCPGARTPPESWIVQSAARAWQTVEGRTHCARQAFGGFTDYPLLSAAMPTVRFGIDPGRAPDGMPPWTLGVAPVSGMVSLTQKMLLVALETCAFQRC